MISLGSNFSLSLSLKTHMQLPSFIKVSMPFPKLLLSGAWACKLHTTSSLNWDSLNTGTDNSLLSDEPRLHTGCIWICEECGSSKVATQADLEANHSYNYLYVSAVVAKVNLFCCEYTGPLWKRHVMIWFCILTKQMTIFPLVFWMQDQTWFFPSLISAKFPDLQLF